MHLLFTPNHLQLLNACYPPSSGLLTAGPDYSPNSHELSRLTYYASNHPGKLTKLGSELEKRLKIECRKARNGNVRSRASLLISLSIFRSLATECRRDIVLISPALISSVGTTLSSLPSDLEVIARAATVFTAWTTYTNGHLIGADSSMTRDYLSALEQFAALSCNDAPDPEIRNRTRLIGFAAITGSLNSEALYNDSTQFRTQASIVLRPILIVLFQTEIATLDEQATLVKDAPTSRYLAEFRTRPTMERRAASIHVHIDGDKGPSSSDVLDTVLRALFSLLGHANGVQLGFIMQSSFDNLDDFNGWTNPEHCCWFVQRAAEWAQYQYRYVVPTWLVERLMENQESHMVTPLHIALTAMVTTVFNSPTPLVNLSSSDIISNLITLLLRRISISSSDTLLPAVVDCISSLGRHVYYSDQIQDLAGELVNRIVFVEVQGILGTADVERTSDTRSTAVRSLLRGLMGLIMAANKHEHIGERENLSLELAKKELAINERTSSRTRVPPDIWQDTLSLICDPEFAVRADYSDALVFYLTHEMQKYGDAPDHDGVKRVRKLTGGPLMQAAHLSNLLNAGDAGNKFINAIHAYIYILATSPSLALMSKRSSSSFGATSKSRSEPDNQTPSSANGRRSLSGPQAQKISLIHRLLEGTSSCVSDATSACFSDYINILTILMTIQVQIPARGLLSCVPMLLALNGAANPQGGALAVRRSMIIRQIIARVWLTIGNVWNSSKVVDLAEQALSDVPSSDLLPVSSMPKSQGSELWKREPVEIQEMRVNCTKFQGIDIEEALAIISSNKAAQDATGLDTDGLYKRLTVKWSPDWALREGDRSGNFETTIRGDGLSPLLKISPALMHIENVSLQSLARSTRGLGVTDLREALEGRSSMSNPALARPPSISTLDHTSSHNDENGGLRLTQTRSRSRTKKRTTASGTGEVKDVLSRLGIGKQGSNLLKASFPSLQKTDQRLAAHKG